MKRTFEIAAVLAAICAAGLILAVRHKAHFGAGRAAKATERAATLSDVLPEFDNDPGSTTNTFREKGADWVFHVARRGGKYVGAAVVSTSKKGYGGPMQVLVGIQADNTVRQIRILSHEETAAFGTMIQDPSFRNQFSGRPAGETKWKIRKEGGDIDAITGATISCRAVTDAVRNGVEVYVKHVEEIRRTGETHPASEGDNSGKRSSFAPREKREAT